MSKTATIVVRQERNGFSYNIGDLIVWPDCSAAVDNRHRELILGQTVISLPFITGYDGRISESPEADVILTQIRDFIKGQFREEEHRAFVHANTEIACRVCDVFRCPPEYIDRLAWEVKTGDIVHFGDYDARVTVIPPEGYGLYEWQWTDPKNEKITRPVAGDWAYKVKR